MHAKTRSALIGLGVSACLFAGPAALAASVSGPIGNTALSQGDRGFPVRVLQADLAQLGDFGGLVTGYFGPVTAAALSRFQSSHGLTANGVLDAATLQTIENAMGIGGGGSSGGGTANTSSTAGTGGGSSGGRFIQGTHSPTIGGGLQVGGTIDGLAITRVIDLTATAYGATAQDNYPYGATDAFGLPLKPGDVAVDPRVIPLNTKLYVTGYRTPYLPKGGELAVARDTGGAIKGRRIDMYVDSTNESLINSFGIQQVTAYILGN